MPAWSLVADGAIWRFGKGGPSPMHLASPPRPEGTQGDQGRNDSGESLGPFSIVSRSFVRETWHIATADVVALKRFAPNLLHPSGLSPFGFPFSSRNLSTFHCGKSLPASRVRIPKCTNGDFSVAATQGSAVRRAMDDDATMTREKTSTGCVCGSLWLHGTSSAWYSLQNARLQPVGSLAFFPLWEQSNPRAWRSPGAGYGM